MSLEGVLSDFGVGEIFQLIGQQRKTGVLEIRHGDTCFEVAFVAGQVLRARPSETRPDGALAGFLLRTGLLAEPDLAEARREQDETLDPLPEVLMRQEKVRKADLEHASQLLTDETIFELFLWDEGRFLFRPEDDLAEGIGDRLQGAEGVLLDALRMRDEWSQIRGALPDFGGVPALSQSADEVAGQLGQIAESSGVPLHTLERIACLVDGRLTLRRVIDLSREGTFQAARAVAVLITRGILRVEQRAARAVAEEQEGPATSRVEVLLPFLPLCAAPLALFLLLWPGPRPDTYPAAHPALTEAREQVETERLRAALESFRWRAGRYPDRLEEVSEAGALLAPVPLDRYSYRRTSGGYTLARGAPFSPRLSSGRLSSGPLSPGAPPGDGEHRRDPQGESTAGPPDSIRPDGRGAGEPATTP